MVLAKGEVLIKDWNYANSKSGGLFSKVETHANLSVTSKRIIYSAESKRSVERQEIPLDKVKTLSMSRSAEANGWIIFRIIFFAIFSVILIGIPGLVRAIKELNSGMFHLEITTEGITTPSLEVETQKTVVRKRRAKNQKVKIMIDKHVVEEIIDELGAIIVENKQNSVVA